MIKSTNTTDALRVERLVETRGLYRGTSLIRKHPPL